MEYQPGKYMLGEEGTEQFTVETRIDGKTIKVQPIHDPFIDPGKQRANKGYVQLHIYDNATLREAIDAARKDEAPR